MHVTLQPRSYRTTGAAKTPDTQTVASEESLVFGTRERSWSQRRLLLGAELLLQTQSQSRPSPTHRLYGGRGGDGGIFLSFSWAAIHGVAKSQTRLSNCTELGLIPPLFLPIWERRLGWPQECVLFGLGEKIGNQLKKKKSVKKMLERQAKASNDCWWGQCGGQLNLE